MNLPLATILGLKKSSPQLLYISLSFCLHQDWRQRVAGRIPQVLCLGCRPRHDADNAVSGTKRLAGQEACGVHLHGVGVRLTALY